MPLNIRGEMFLGGDVMFFYTLIYQNDLKEW